MSEKADRMDSNPIKPFHEYDEARDMDRFWEEIRPEREPFQKRWYIPAIILLLVVGAPWYWGSGNQTPILAGLPVWVWITIGSTFAIGVLTAVMAVFFWEDDPDRDNGDS